MLVSCCSSWSRVRYLGHRHYPSRHLHCPLLHERQLQDREKRVSYMASTLIKHNIGYVDSKATTGFEAATV